MDLTPYRELHHQMASRSIEDETVLVPLKNDVASMDTMYVLNGSGSVLWLRLRDPLVTYPELVSHLMVEFEVDQQTGQSDVKEFLEDLNSLLLTK